MNDRLNLQDWPKIKKGMLDFISDVECRIAIAPPEVHEDILNDVYGRYVGDE